MNASQPNSASVTLDKKLAEFIGLLRSSGLAVGSSEFLDAARALVHVDVKDAPVLRECLRATLVKKPDFYSVFESLFDSFWLASEAKPGSAPAASQIREHGRDLDEKCGAGFTGSAERRNPSMRKPMSLVLRNAGLGSVSPAAYGPMAYSGAEALSKKSFEGFDTRDKPTLKRNLRLLSKRLATLAGRRATPRLRGDVDLKDTLKRGMKSQGEILKIVRRKHRKSRNRFVFLCDISGSMDHFEARLFEIMYYASNTFPSARVFGFSTGLVRLDGLLRGKSLVEAVDSVSENLLLWGSGTRIGESINELLRDHPYALDRRALVVVVSDGWDLGDQRELEGSLSRLKQKVNALIWVNPLADDADYEPLTPAVLSALQYADLFGGTRILLGSGASIRALNKKV
jgi:uncharacterized protein with von Willebrand factor type A (vWA) domain